MTRRVYLDNAGAGVPSSQQLEEFSNFLKTNLLANPHSHHATAQQTFAIVENARMRSFYTVQILYVTLFRVLAFLGTSHEDYHIVFTHNATHSLKIIAECFRYRHPERAPKMANLKDLSSNSCEDISVCLFVFRWKVNVINVERLSHLCAGNARSMAQQVSIVRQRCFSIEIMNNAS